MTKLVLDAVANALACHTSTSTTSIYSYAHYALSTFYHSGPAVTGAPALHRCPLLLVWRRDKRHHRNNRLPKAINNVALIPVIATGRFLNARILDNSISSAADANMLTHHFVAGYKLLQQANIAIAGGYPRASPLHEYLCVTKDRLTTRHLHTNAMSSSKKIS
jgi:hypothetical protein